MRALCLVVVAVVAAAGFEDEYPEGVGNEIMDMSKEAKISLLEAQAVEAEREMQPKLNRLMSLRQEQRRVDDGIIFQGTAAKAMEPAIREAERVYMEAQHEVDIIRKQIKPLHGVVSYQHLEEHKVQIYSSFQASVEVAQNHMWWNMILGSTESGSLEELIRNMIGSFIMGLSIGYVIGLFKFIITAPFTIFQYTSSILDIPAALGMWVLGVLLFLTPLFFIILSCRFLGPHLADHVHRQQAQPRVIRQRHFQ